VEGLSSASSEEMQTNKNAVPLLGIGLYSVNDVSVLLGIPTTTVHRWIVGYSFPLSRWSKSHKPPVFIPSLPRSDGKVGLTFLDLVQLRVVQGFRKAGVPLQRIRVAALTAADVFGASHPFAFERFKTDGRDVFAKVVVDAAEVGLLNLSSGGQRAFPEWVEQSLRELTFATKTRLAERWYIAGPGGGVVIDPRNRVRTASRRERRRLYPCHLGPGTVRRETRIARRVVPARRAPSTRRAPIRRVCRNSRGVTFFFDNNLSPVLARGLREFGEDVQHFARCIPSEYARRGVASRDWERGWYLVTRDKKIRPRPHEIDALLRSNVGAFTFTQKRDPLRWGWVELVVRRWVEIQEFADSHERPFVAGIPERGRIELVRSRTR